jgi:hypothetical protein
LLKDVVEKKTNEVNSESHGNGLETRRETCKGMHKGRYETVNVKRQIEGRVRKHVEARVKRHVEGYVWRQVESCVKRHVKRQLKDMRRNMRILEALQGLTKQNTQ